MIGKKLGRFEVVERIDAGGMGEIYRARHEELALDVAVKVLPKRSAVDQTARKLFHREARTLAKLKHPHIGSIHDFGTTDGADYLVMELIPGTDLAAKLQEGALLESEVLRLGTQIADALEEAHEQQIVHLDLKPKNVMVTPKGQVKVLDFGLAKLVRSIDEATTKSMTELQSVAGTLPYMAPEQLKDGADVDARTDVYALGATLYEMATGRRPFEQTDANKLITAILQTAPPRPRAIQNGVSDDLERVVLKSMEKEPGRRYQTVKELREDLQRCAAGMSVSAPRHRPRWINRLALGTAGFVVALGLVLGLNPGGILRPTKPLIASLAVLPFTNLMEDQSQEYFVDGMTDRLTVSLAALADLKVIGRQSVMPYRDTNKSLAEIGDELGVGAVLQASVLRDSSQVQIIAQLTDVKSGSLLWGETLTRDMSGILTLMNEVTTSIAESIKLRLRPDEQERLRQTRPVHPQAFEAYVRGRMSQFQWTRNDLQRAIGFYRRAIEFDSDYAAAYAGIAESYWFLGAVGLGVIPPKEAYSKAMPELRKALELDPSSAEAHAVLGQISIEYDRDWARAEQEYKRAIELRPNFAMARVWYAQLLSPAGRHDEALEQVRSARELEPSDDNVNGNVVCRLWQSGDFKGAIAEGKKALAGNLAEDFVTRVQIGIAQLLAGELVDAIGTFGELLQDYGDNSFISSYRGQAYARAGEREKAIAILNDLQQLDYVPALPVATLYAELGDLNKAFNWLETAYETRENLNELKTPLYSAFHSDPRFGDLVRRIGIPD